MDVKAHLLRQKQWSAETFGPHSREGRTAGVTDHLKKEIREIESKPGDLSEWIDIVILAIDGAFSEGFTPLEVIRAWEAKQQENEDRTWPDWRTADPTKAIEHVRTPEEQAAKDFEAHNEAQRIRGKTFSADTFDRDRHGNKL